MKKYDEYNYAKMDPEVVRNLYGEYMKEKILSQYKFPEEKSTDGFYHIWVKDPGTKSGRRQIKASTIEILKNKVYSFEKKKEEIGRKTFKECYELQKSQRKRRVKNESKKYSLANTERKSDCDYRRFFEGSDFEEMYIDEITNKDIEKFYEDILLKFDLKMKASAGLKVVLSKTFKYALSEDYIDINPYDKCNFDKFSDMIIEDTPIAKRVHTGTETEMILKAARAKQITDPKYTPAYALELQMLMGARRGEIPPLTWNDILDDRIWIHREQLNTYRQSGFAENGFVIVEHTKTGVERYFPITSGIRELLKRLDYIHKKYYSNSNFLFPADTKLGCITNNVVYQFYKRTCNQLDIKNTPGVTKGTHSFRRNAITNMVNKSGGNFVLASRLYGNSPRTAERNYYTGIDISEAKKYLEV